jgi:hypothetical protein
MFCWLCDNYLFDMLLHGIIFSNLQGIDTRLAYLGRLIDMACFLNTKEYDDVLNL